MNVELPLSASLEEIQAAIEKAQANCRAGLADACDLARLVREQVDRGVSMALAVAPAMEISAHEALALLDPCLVAWPAETPWSGICTRVRVTLYGIYVERGNPATAYENGRLTLHLKAR